MPDNNPTSVETPGSGQTQDFETMYKESSAEWHKRYEQAKKMSTMAVKADPKNLISIYDEDPKLAENIAKSEYNLSYEDAKKQIEWFSPSNWSSEDDLADKVYSKIQAKAEEAKTSDTVKSFYEKNGIDGEFKKDFESIYNDLIDGKSVTSDAAKKYLNIAFREAKQTSKNLNEHEKAVKDAKAAWLTTGKGDGGKTPRPTWRQILKWSNRPTSWY